ncbi:restriction endonuclease subunit S [Maridesulfovibrio sp.]|uniref:restriction endonuclease subunit S n=1 Tax=Maridesulfovibrio sp. TaxID=2795000 RepID=UPI0029CA6D17|nr:restriction endonuclease subunit S [Maridesulfovibrio sp.]
MVPDGWTLGNLGDLAETQMGFAFKSTDFVEQGVPLIRMGNLYQNNFDLSRNPVFLPDTFLDEYERFILKSGDLIMSLTGTIGKQDYGFTIQIPNESPSCLLNQRVMKLIPKDATDKAFLLHLLKSQVVLSKLYSFPGGTKQANLSAAQVKGIMIGIPPLPEQKKIARILSTWDKAIEKVDKLIENSKQQKKALMQQLLTGKKRLPGFSSTYDYCQTKYGLIPTDWDFVELNRLAKETGMKNIKNENLPVLSCSKHEGFVDSLKYFKKKVYSDNLSTYKLISRGELGFPSNHIEEGSIGLQNLYEKGLVSPIYTVFKPTENLSRDYIYLLLKTEHYRQIFAAQTNASVDRRGSLRWKEFGKIKVPRPSIAEQKAISKMIIRAETRTKALSNHLDNLKQQKQALMQQLLTGKRRVKITE